MPLKIMILGGNLAQVPLIQTAQREGYAVVLVDFTTTNPGVAIADIHYQVDFRDKDTVLSIAKNEQIKGVISNSEAAMPVVAYVAEQMGLVGNSERSIIRLSSKDGFRELQKESGLFYPKSIVTETFEEAMAAVSQLAFPVIIKPCNSSGSRGTTVVADLAEFAGREKEWYMCSKYSLTGKVVVEEFVAMTDLDHVIDGDIFVHKGKFFWNGMFSSKRSKEAPMIPMTQTYPIDLSSERLQEVKNGIARLFACAGVVHGEYNIEAYYTEKDELFFIEINARQGGNGIPRMVEAHAGVDMYRLLVTTAMGDDSYFCQVINTARPIQYIARHPVYSHRNGLYKGLYISKEAAKYVTGIDYKINNGSTIPAVSMASDAAAFVSLSFPDRATQLRTVEEIERLIYPIVQEEPLIADLDFPVGKMIKFLEKNDRAFTRPLSESVAAQGMTLQEYARKLCAKGTVVYEPDGGEIKGMLIGYTHGLPENGGSYITQVVTDEQFRGQGVFKRLFASYAAFCGAKGIKIIWLTTNENNAAARSAYERVGFVASPADARGLIKYTYQID